MATVTLFVSIFNLFTRLLQLLGFTNASDRASEHPSGQIVLLLMEVP